MANGLPLLFAAVRDGHWYWGLGDPDLGAVLVTGFYFLVAIACLMVGRQTATVFIAAGASKSQPSEATAWWTLAAMMFCLGINKQADLQSLLTLYGRDILRHAGLYGVRRTIQGVFIVGVALSAFASVLLCLWIVRRLSWPCRVATIGLGLQAAFIVVRGASFHHVDKLLGLQLNNLKLNLLFESVGLTVILFSAVVCWTQAPAENH